MLVILDSLLVVNNVLVRVIFWNWDVPEERLSDN